MLEEQTLEERIAEILDNSFLAPYLRQDGLTDIQFNGNFLTLQNNKTGKEHIPMPNCPSKEEVMELGQKIANEMGKQFTTSDPILDVALPNIRVNYIHSDVSPVGCTFSLRISKPVLALTDISQTAIREVAELLNILIKTKQNIIISGKTGAGKTELQKYLVQYMNKHDNIIVIEDTMDSHIQELYPDYNIMNWRTRTEESREKKVTYSDLIKAGLRNNPDWLIIAETRGSEAYTMLEGALTDHSIITTIHAKGATSIPDRIIFMVGQDRDINESLVGRSVVNVLKFGIYLTLEETSKGYQRYIKEIVEFTDYTPNGVVYNPIYTVHREFDEKENKYKKVINVSRLSKETTQIIKDKGYFHKIPECFKWQEKES